MALVSSPILRTRWSAPSSIMARAKLGMKAVVGGRSRAIGVCRSVCNWCKLVTSHCQEQRAESNSNVPDHSPLTHAYALLLFASTLYEKG